MIPYKKQIEYHYAMRFELTEELIDDILFSMEDQNGEFRVDTAEGVVAGPDIPGEEGSGGGRYIPLPAWNSAEGFRLMERFAAGFRNPLVREELSYALNRGRGVFRAFKDALSGYPGAEKRWFLFKKREMKREIVRWYNGLREEWGLEKIGMEPEETGDLVLEDFRFRPFTAEHLDKARNLHLSCLEEYRRALAETGARDSAGPILREALAFYHLPRSLFSGVPAPPAAAMTAESGGGEFAGYISGLVEDSTLFIQTLEVKAEYRGLGVGEALLSRFLDSFGRGEVSRALIDLPFWAEGFSRVLLRESFKPYTVRYRLDLPERED
jgi:GNAT superfamily N-acetyltransferase